jgi:hypothetical protein
MISDDGVNVLADLIIMQAVQDWRRICKRLEKGKRQSTVYNDFTSLTRLRIFFKSDWCDLLCRQASSAAILDQLEAEYLEMMKAVEKTPCRRMELRRNSDER